MPTQSPPPDLDKLGSALKGVLAARKPPSTLPPAPSPADLRRQFTMDENGQLVEIFPER